MTPMPEEMSPVNVGVRFPTLVGVRFPTLVGVRFPTLVGVRFPNQAPCSTWLRLHEGEEDCFMLEDLARMSPARLSARSSGVSPGKRLRIRTCFKNGDGLAEIRTQDLRHVKATS